MSRKGHYLGGSTIVSARDATWFGQGGRHSNRDPSPRWIPERSPEEQREYEAFKKKYGAQFGESKLIKNGGNAARYGTRMGGGKDSSNSSKSKGGAETRFAAKDAAHFKAFRSKEWEILETKVRILSKNGIRKPREVSDALNQQGIRTGAGREWTPKLAWFLLNKLYQGHFVPEEISKRQHRPKSTKVPNLPEPKGPGRKKRMNEKIRQEIARIEARRAAPLAKT